MKTQDILAILGVAAATMAFTIGLTAPGQVDAVDQAPPAEAKKITPIIGQPTLKIADLQIGLKMDKANYAAGDKPVVMLATSNPTDRRIETNVWIGMTSASPESMFSRALTLPTYIWSKNVPVVLEPGESKQLEFAVEKELVAGHSVSVTMSDTDQKAAFAKLLSPAPKPNNMQKEVAVVTPTP